MRSFVIGLLLVLTIPCAATAQQTKFPYEATVDQDGAYVRSGQGKSYYPTGRLRKGDRVTVRRHDPGGWYMILPPPGSFSWILAEQVQKKSADSGTVKVNNAVVRVGSFDSDVHDFFQQKLSQGDEIRILGEKMLAEEKQPPKLWYKIEPPRNEFRWIEGRALLPVTRPTAAPPGANGDPFDQNYTGLPRGKAAAKTPSARTADSVPVAGNGPAHPIYDQPVTKNDPLVERPLVRREGKPRAGDAVAQNGPSRSELDTQREELDRLDARFRSILAQDFVQWEFSELERDYVDLRDRVTHPTYERLIDGKLTSIQNYKKIKAEQDEFLRITAETNQRDAELLAQQQRHEAKLVRKESPKFDGAGIVQRATNPRPGAPQHVLIAPNGRVLAHLQAQPGIDLDAWLGRSVGLTGPRTSRPELGSDLIVVTGITPVKLAP